jgi:predicted phage tail protein
MSGASDVITFPTNAATTISVDGVPPGIYFVRVRAINSLGLSRAYNEVQVVVH